MGPQSPQHIAASLAATDVIFVSQVLTRDCISSLLLIAITIFAFTLPINVMFYVLDDDFVAAQQEQQQSARINILFARFVGLLTMNLIGFVLIFFHFGVLPGALFALTSLLLVRWVLSGAEPGATLRLLRRVVISLFRRLPPVESTPQMPR